MEIKLKNIIDKHKKGSCIIVGSGHSMANFDYQNFKGKILCVGATILRLNNIIEPDYLITCNNHFPVINNKSHLNYLNTFSKIVWIMSDTDCYNDVWDYKPELFNKLRLDYIKYDDRHFEKKSCNLKKECCSFR